jgi:hypothetical protein
MNAGHYSDNPVAVVFLVGWPVSKRFRLLKMGENFNHPGTICRS